MFSPNELLHFVFADGNDSYYCNELLSLDLHQYLWLKLHERGYGCVYYLELSDDAVCIKTYGDKLAQGYTPEKAKIFSFSKQRPYNNGLRKWLLKMLSDKAPTRSAIVCDLRSFCSYFEKSEWDEFLPELALLERRSGILLLTAPPEAEATRSIFLNSLVFDRLQENGITILRDASPCDLYTAMHRNRPDRMVYLNTYTRERIHSMLSRILLGNAKYTPDYHLLPYMEDFLLQWLNNAPLRAKESQLENKLPRQDSRFQNAYELLRQEDSWRQLTAKATQISQLGGIEAYAAQLDCTLAEDPVNAVCVRRDPDSYAWSSSHLHLRLTGCPEEELCKIRQLIEDIRAKVGAPLNREENPHLVESIRSLLIELEAADFDNDSGTVRRILFSIKFCLQWVCIPKSSSEEAAIRTVLDKLKSYVECSKLYHNQKRSYELVRARQGSGAGKLTAMSTRKLEAEVETARRLLNTYEDMVQAAVVKLSLASEESVSSLVKELSEEMTKQIDDVRTASSDADMKPNVADEPQDEPNVEEPLPSEGPSEPSDPKNYVYTLNAGDFDI